MLKLKGDTDMDVKGIVFEDFTHDTDVEFSFQCKGTKDLYDKCDQVRRLMGMTDFPEESNILYYNIYVIVNTEKESISLRFNINNSMEDDLKWYSIPLTIEQENMLLWKVIYELSEMD